MITRRSYIFFAAIGLMLIVAALISVAKNDELEDLRLFIENQYQSEILMIENSMRIGWETSGTKESDDKLFEEWERQLDSVEEIEHALAGPEFFSAHWSLDGHHAMQTLKPLPTEYVRKGGYLFENSNRKHTLYYGEAFDGTELLIYVGRVESKWKRDYQIAFRRTEISGLLRDHAKR